MSRRAQLASLSNHSHTQLHTHFRRHGNHQGRRCGHQVRIGKVRASVQVGHLAQDLGRHQVAPLRGDAPQLDVIGDAPQMDDVGSRLTFRNLSSFVALAVGRVWAEQGNWSCQKRVLVMRITNIASRTICETLVLFGVHWCLQISLPAEACRFQPPLPAEARVQHDCVGGVAYHACTFLVRNPAVN